MQHGKFRITSRTRLELELRKDLIYIDLYTCVNNKKRKLCGSSSNRCHEKENTYKGKVVKEATEDEDLEARDDQDKSKAIHVDLELN